MISHQSSINPSNVNVTQAPSSATIVSVGIYNTVEAEVHGVKEIKPRVHGREGCLSAHVIVVVEFQLARP